MLTLADTLVKTVDGVEVPRAGVVTAYPVNRPCLVFVDTDWLEEPMHKHRRSTIAADGAFAIDLPWPSETSLVTDWIVTLDDGTKLRGAIPEGVTDATIEELLDDHGWAQVETPGTTAVIGAPGLVWRGTWDSAAHYLPGQAVGYQGSSYIAVLASTNLAPSINPTKWDLLAAKGADGGLEIP